MCRTGTKKDQGASENWSHPVRLWCAVWDGRVGREEAREAGKGQITRALGWKLDRWGEVSRWRAKCTFGAVRHPCSLWVLSFGLSTKPRESSTVHLCAYSWMSNTGVSKTRSLTVKWQSASQASALLLLQWSKWKEISDSETQFLPPEFSLRRAGHLVSLRQAGLPQASGTPAGPQKVQAMPQATRNKLWPARDMKTDLHDGKPITLQLFYKDWVRWWS
jgi:hypothetical protein